MTRGSVPVYVVRILALGAALLGLIGAVFLAFDAFAPQPKAAIRDLFTAIDRDYGAAVFPNRTLRLFARKARSILFAILGASLVLTIWFYFETGLAFNADTLRLIVFALGAFLVAGGSRLAENWANDRGFISIGNGLGIAVKVSLVVAYFALVPFGLAMLVFTAGLGGLAPFALLVWWAILTPIILGYGFVRIGLLADVLPGIGVVSLLLAFALQVGDAIVG
jgi:hypothetical protein